MKSPRVNFRLKQEILKDVDHLIADKLFKDRTEFFTTATIQLLGHYKEYEESLRGEKP